MRIHGFTLLFCICFVSLLHSQETVELPYIEDLAPDMKETLQEGKERFELYDEASGKEINNSASFMGIVFRGDNINSLPLHHEFRHLMVNILSHHDTYIEQFLNEGLAESADTFMPDEEMPYHRYKIQDLY